MKKLLVVTENYPDAQNIYANAFIHSRLVLYRNEFEIYVLVYSSKNKKNIYYEYQGIKVHRCLSKKNVYQEMTNYNPDVIGIHFFQYWMLNTLIKKAKVPVSIWVHGYEALGWYRRFYDFQWKKFYIFGGYILWNIYQLYYFRKVIQYSNITGHVNFIFVSDWMRRITSNDTFIKIKNYYIIPNIINVDLFPYKEKHEKERLKILLIRPFTSNKYANDIAINAIWQLSKKKYFNELKFLICGKGPQFSKLVYPLSIFKNVSYINDFIPHTEMPQLHSEYGIFLCPTRQDAQGVTMCEAMSSGLVVISSNNTAIPEFIENGKSGFLSNSSSDIVDIIDKIYHNPDLFFKISKEGAIHIKKLASYEASVKKEIDLLKSLCKK